MNKVVVGLSLAMIDLIVGDLLLFGKGRRRKSRFSGGERRERRRREERKSLL